jgi:hypothetical protein
MTCAHLLLEISNPVQDGDAQTAVVDVFVLTEFRDQPMLWRVVAIAAVSVLAVLPLLVQAQEGLVYSSDMESGQVNDTVKLRCEVCQAMMRALEPKVRAPSEIGEGMLLGSDVRHGLWIW